MLNMERKERVQLWFQGVVKSMVVDLEKWKTVVMPAVLKLRRRGDWQIIHTYPRTGSVEKELTGSVEKELLALPEYLIADDVMAELESGKIEIQIKPSLWEKLYYLWAKKPPGLVVLEGMKIGLYLYQKQSSIKSNGSLTGEMLAGGFNILLDALNALTVKNASGFYLYIQY